MTVSVIIPHMPGLDGVDSQLNKTLDSLHGYDELILVVNDGHGFGPSVNVGLRYARGNFLVVMNNDIEFIEGDVRDLSDNRGVCVPVIYPEPRDNNPRSIYSMPRWVFDKLGGYDERFKMGYFEDDDFIVRLQEAEIPILLSDRVVVSHLNGGGLTMKQVGEQEWFETNRREFERKYNGNRNFVTSGSSRSNSNLGS